MANRAAADLGEFLDACQRDLPRRPTLNRGQSQSYRAFGIPVTRKALDGQQSINWWHTGGLPGTATIAGARTAHLGPAAFDASTSFDNMLAS